LLDSDGPFGCNSIAQSDSLRIFFRAKTNCENSEDHRHDSSHKPPRPDSSSGGFPAQRDITLTLNSVPLLRTDYWSVLTKVGLHAFHQCPEESGDGPSGNAHFVKVVASDHTRIRIPRTVRLHTTVRSHRRCDLPQTGGSQNNGYSTMPEMQTIPPRSHLRLRRKSWMRRDGCRR